MGVDNRTAVAREAEPYRGLTRAQRSQALAAACGNGASINMRAPADAFEAGKRLIAVQGAALDAGYVRAHIVEMLGDDDPRVETWDRLWREHYPASNI